jgi:hypothetical protein
VGQHRFVDQPLWAGMAVSEDNIRAGCTSIGRTRARGQSPDIQIVVRPGALGAGQHLVPLVKPVERLLREPLRRSVLAWAVHYWSPPSWRQRLWGPRCSCPAT